jgi:5'-3' exonuclease
MEEKERLNRVLVAMDVSNFIYFVIFLAEKQWGLNYRREWETVFGEDIERDPGESPDLLNFDHFRMALRNVVQKRLEAINWIVRNAHQEEVDLADGIDIVLSEDSPLDESFRKTLYPEYKANRKLMVHKYNVPVIKRYVLNVIFKELEIEERYGYRIVKVDGCESDDIIAVLMRRFDNYALRVILSSDKDFLQLDGVYQYTMSGMPVERKIVSNNLAKTEYPMTPNEFLLWKIIRGDVSDNIRNVFSGYGEIKAYQLMRDKNTLRRMLSESQESYNRFMLNRKLIDFREIPKELEEKVYAILKEKLLRKTRVEEVEEFSLKSCMEL